MDLRRRISRLEEVLNTAVVNCPTCFGEPWLALHVEIEPDPAGPGFRETGQCWIDKRDEERIAGESIQELRCVQCGHAPHCIAEVMKLKGNGDDMLGHAMGRKVQ